MTADPGRSGEEPREEFKKTSRVNIIISAVLVAGCLFAFPFLYHERTGNDETGIGDNQVNAPPAVEQPVSLQIACVGDVMVHKSQIPSQYVSSTDAYDYNNNFQYIKPYIEQADMALCNVETTFGGKPYTGYPAFSAPDELAEALANAGFDVALTANNHMMDRGTVGLKRTIDVLKGYGLGVSGSKEQPQQEGYALYEAKGIKVGVVAYTYATSLPTGEVLVNGSVISEEGASLINYFRYDHLNEDLEKVKETIAQARAAGAEIVVCYFHWGEEYQLSANQWQRQMAQWIVDNTDAGVIFGSHPHTLQEWEPYKREGEKPSVPVFFSLGNLISNQRQETLNNRYTEIGAIAQVDITYMPESKKIVDIKANTIPTWVEKYKSGGRDIYAVIPLDENLESNEALAASGHLLRAKKAQEDAIEILLGTD